MSTFVDWPSGINVHEYNKGGLEEVSENVNGEGLYLESLNKYSILCFGDGNINALVHVD